MIVRSVDMYRKLKNIFTSLLKKCLRSRFVMLEVSTYIMRAKSGFITGILLIVSFFTVANANIINPKTYYSDNHDFALRVTPSDRFGRGKADYSFILHDVKIWDKTLGATFQEVIISDKGTIFAYSYSYGVESLMPIGTHKDELMLWIIAQNGDIITKKVLKRGHKPNAIHGYQQPMCLGMVLQEKNDTIIFRLTPDDNKSTEKWLPFAVKTGVPKPPMEIVVQFKNQLYHQIEDVVAVVEQGFYLLFIPKFHSVLDNDIIVTRMVGNTIQLRDQTGTLLWQDNNFNDFKQSIIGFNGKELRQFLQNHKIIDYDNYHQTFSVLHLAKHQRTHYKIDEQNNVIELNSDKINPKEWLNQQATSPKKFKTTELKLAQTIALLTEENHAELPSHFRNFAVNKKGQIASIVRENKQWYFYLINKNNTVEQKFALNNKQLQQYDFFTFAAFAYYKNQQWLLLLDSAVESKSLLLSINTLKQSTQVLDYALGYAKNFTVHEDSSLTFLSIQKHVNGLLHLDEKGQILWENFENNSSKPAYLSSLQGIALNQAQTILVFDENEKKVNLYSHNGTFIKSINLLVASAGELDYPIAMAVVDNTLAFAQGDKNDNLVIFRFSMDGEFIGKQLIKSQLGRKLSYVAGLKSRAKNLWIADQNLYQFDSELNEIKHFGQSEKQRRFNHISWISVDEQGDVLLFNDQTFTLIKISIKDKTQSIYSLNPKLIPTDFNGNGISIDAQNNFNFNLNQAKIAVYNTNGRFKYTLNLDKSCKQYCNDMFIAHASRWMFWQLSDYKINLLLHDKKDTMLIKSIAKDKKGNWLKNSERAFSNSNGGLIVLAKNYDSQSSQLYSIYVLNNQADVTHDFVLPYEHGGIEYLSRAGNYIYLKVTAENSIHVYNLNGELKAKMRLNTATDRCFDTVFYADEKTQKLYLYQNKQLLVYSLYSDHQSDSIQQEK